jgi:hypothetical protein
MTKENIQFGEGNFIEEISRDPGFFDLPVREQAKIIGWADSCPITDELTDPENSDPGRGPEAMLQRYAEVNFWFSFIARETDRLNPKLHESLMRPVRREIGEPVGKHEPNNVPDWHARKISPMGTLPGYALPRIFVEQIGTHKGISRDEVQDRLLRGLDIMEAAIVQAKTPNELLALVAEGLLHADCTPGEIMKHTFSAGWIEEHNAHRMMGQFKLMAQHRAPDLINAYNSLTEEEKAQRKLA